MPRAASAAGLRARLPGDGEWIALVTDRLSLSDEDRRLLRSVEALLRGVLSALPRPEPRGDWGRSESIEALRPVRRPVAITVAKEPPREDDPSAATDAGIRGRAPKGRHRRRHTPESKAADAKRIRQWLLQTGLNASQLAAAAGINSGQLFLVRKGIDGMSEKLEQRLLAAVARLVNWKRRGLDAR